MEFSAEKIALLINGAVEGDGTVTVQSFGKIEEAVEGQLAFLANPKYEEYLYISNASIIIINDSQEIKQPVNAVLIRVPDAYSAFANLLQKYQEIVQSQLIGIEQPSYIQASAKLGAHIYVGAFSYIGNNSIIGNNTKVYPGVFIGDNVKIGADTILHPGVKIYHDCILGSSVTIHSGTIVGGDGFGFAPQTDGQYQKVPQIGNVIIEDFVEIGSNTCIDRATIGSTIIRAGAKLDNLIQIAHNVEVGGHTVIAAQTGISGSTKIGNNVMVGGQVGIIGHLQIANGSKINAQSGVVKSIKKENTSITGSPAFDYASSLKSQAITRRLPDLEKRIIELERIIQQLISSR